MTNIELNTKNFEGGQIHFSNSDMLELIKEVIGKGGAFRFEAKGSSMSPFIKNLDIITISAVGDRIVKNGEILAIKKPVTAKLIVHRVVFVKKNTCIIKGDNLHDDDGEIPFKNILGVVTKIERKGKNISFGVGVERYIISLLSISGLLIPLKLFLKFIISFFKK